MKNYPRTNKNNFKNKVMLRLDNKKNKKHRIKILSWRIKRVNKY